MRGDNTHWLDKLEEEEDDVIPPVGGGIEIPEGSKARGGSEAPEGSQAPGGRQTVPHIIVDDEDGAPREGSVPLGPQEGERAPGGGSEVPPRSVVSEDPSEPRPVSGAEAGGSAEAPRAEGTVKAPAPTTEEAGAHPTVPGASRGPQGAPSSQKKAAPRARCVLQFWSFLLIFIFLFLLTCVIPFLAGSTRRLQWSWLP